MAVAGWVCVVQEGALRRALPRSPQGHNEASGGARIDHGGAGWVLWRRTSWARGRWALRVQVLSWAVRRRGQRATWTASRVYMCGPRALSRALLSSSAFPPGAGVCSARSGSCRLWRTLLSSSAFPPRAGVCSARSGSCRLWRTLLSSSAFPPRAGVCSARSGSCRLWRTLLSSSAFPPRAGVCSARSGSCRLWRTLLSSSAFPPRALAGLSVVRSITTVLVRVDQLTCVPRCAVGSGLRRAWHVRSALVCLWGLDTSAGLVSQRKGHASLSTPSVEACKAALGGAEHALVEDSASLFCRPAASLGCAPLCVCPWHAVASAPVLLFPAFSLLVLSAGRVLGRPPVGARCTCADTIEAGRPPAPLSALLSRSPQRWQLSPGQPAVRRQRRSSGRPRRGARTLRLGCQGRARCPRRLTGAWRANARGMQRTARSGCCSWAALPWPPSSKTATLSRGEQGTIGPQAPTHTTPRWRPLLLSLRSLFCFLLASPRRPPCPKERDGMGGFAEQPWQVGPEPRCRPRAVLLMSTE